MQVTHKTDHITHAVIGGQAAHSFGINDSPEFFRILSSSLYSDKKLAVIREILCNAHDAHVEFGVTRPIEVTVSNDQLIIRDFGPGISPGDITKNYTTYGGTTKLANEKVTGGFGLGSKAPFAYADHFEVVSCHKGRKHIYRMSLSNAEVDGKPSVMKIMDAICGDETGVQVSVDIDSSDRRSFEEIVRKIARNGEMSVQLNGDDISTLPFSQAPNGFIMLPSMATGHAAWCQLRYGHVIYPVELDKRFGLEWDRARKFLRSIDNRGNRWHNDDTWSVVLYAEPGDVSVTPSRETLSMTDKTVETIRKLLAEFANKVEGKLDDECVEILKEAVSTIWADGVPGTLCNPKKLMPNKAFFARKKGELGNALFTVREAAWHFMCGENYPGHARFYFEDLKLRVQAMIDQDFGDKPLNRRYLQELKRLGKAEARSSWFQKRVVWPLINDLKQQEASGTHALKLKNMFSVEWGNKARGYGQALIMLPVGSLHLPAINEALPYLRRRVILTHNRSEVVDPELNIDLRKKLEDYHGSLRSTFCYVVPRQPAKILEAINFFTARGFEITDMTPEQVIERDPNAPKTVSRPRRKGLPTLSSFVNDEGKFEASFGYYHNPKAVLTETPQFATMINPNRINLDHFGGSSAMVIGPILRLWGDLGVACPSRASYDKMLELGVKPIEEWVMAQLETELANNTAIATYYQAYAPADFNFGERVMELFAVVRNDETLRKRFKMPAHLPQRERDLVTLLEMWSSDDYTLSRKHPAIYAIKQSWKASPASLKLYDTVHKNPLLKAINLTQLIGMTRNAAPELALKARKLLLSVLKG